MPIVLVWWGQREAENETKMRDSARDKCGNVSIAQMNWIEQQSSVFCCCLLSNSRTQGRWMRKHIWLNFQHTHTQMIAHNINWNQHSKLLPLLLLMPFPQSKASNNNHFPRFFFSLPTIPHRCFPKGFHIWIWNIWTVWVYVFVSSFISIKYSIVVSLS